MKAFAVVGNDKFEFVDIDIPKPRDYEVLVKNEGCLFCNSTDWMIVSKLFASPDYPILLGHESFGKVIKVGAKVRNFKLGDRVICSNAVPTGYNGKYYSTWGGFAEYGIAGDYLALVEDKCPIDGEFSYRKRYAANFKIDNKLELELASLVFPLSETASCVMQVPEIINKDVAVFGTGTAGYTMAMFAKLKGAKTVTVFGRREERAKKSLEFLADYGKISENAYTENLKYDVVFEVTGNNQVFSKGMPFLKENGIVAVYGVSTNPYEFNLRNVPINFRIRAISPDVGKAIDFVEDLIRNEKIPVSKLLTHIWSFEQAEEAIRMVKDGVVIKGLVKF